MEHSTSGKSYSRSADQEAFHFLCNPKFHYRDHKNLSWEMCGANAELERYSRQPSWLIERHKYYFI